MSLLDQALELAGPVAGALGLGGGGLLGYLGIRARSEAKRAEARASERKAAAGVQRSEIVRAERERVAALEHDRAVAGPLLQALQERDRILTEMRDEVRDELRRAAEDCDERLEEERERCDQRLDEQQSQITTLAGVVERLSRPERRDDPDEITGLHEVREMARRSPTPPGAWRADPQGDETGLRPRGDDR